MLVRVLLLARPCAQSARQSQGLRRMLHLKPLLALCVFSAVEHGENQSKADTTENKAEKQQKPERRFAGIRIRHPERLRNCEQAPEREGQGEHTQHQCGKFRAVHPDHCP